MIPWGTLSFYSMCVNVTMVTLVMVYIKMNRYNQVLLDICHFSLFLFMSARGTTVVMLTQENIFYWLFSSILTSKRGKKTEGKREREKAIPVYKRMTHYSRSDAALVLLCFTCSIHWFTCWPSNVRKLKKMLLPSSPLLFQFPIENPFYAVVSKKVEKECHLSFFLLPLIELKNPFFQDRNWCFLN